MRRASGWLALTALLCGCAEELGPWRRQVVDQEGRVRVGREPVRGGFVEFYPIQGTVGVLRSAPIGPDGRFRVTGVGPGRNVVRIVNPPPSPPVSRVFELYYSPIRPIVDGKTFLDIDLRREGGGFGGRPG